MWLGGAPGQNSQMGMTGPSNFSQNYNQGRTQYSNYPQQAQNYKMAPGYSPLDNFESDLMGGLALPPDISEIDADISKQK